MNNNLETRPSWDIYYLTIAFIVAQRSFDPSTKCGCVIVSRFNNILSTGYNGPLSRSNDDNVPLERPEKYYALLHAEENSLLAYNGSHYDIQNATAYITTAPCHKCLRMLLQKGITRIVSGPQITKVVDQNDLNAQKLMLNYYKQDYNGQPRAEQEILYPSVVQELLTQTSNYISTRYHDIK